MSHALLIWIALIALAATLVFSTLSYALRMMSRVRLDEELVRAGRAEKLEAILAARYDVALASATLRLVSSAVVIIAIASRFLLDYMDDPQPLKVFGWTLLVSIPLLLIFSVAIPQAWGRYAGEKLVVMCWPMLRLALWLTWPLVRVLNIFDEAVRRLAGVSIGEDADTAAEQVEQFKAHGHTGKLRIILTALEAISVLQDRLMETWLALLVTLNILKIQNCLE